MTPARRAALIAQWLREEQAPFTGWDYAHLAGRMVEDELPWSYVERAGVLLERARSALDLGTGGGERLLELQRHWPARLVVTEDYPPNIRLAGERLGRLGVDVVCAAAEDHTPLPFVDAAFDAVLNRHSAFNAAEVARVLAPGGVFLTQQVHGRWAEDLLAYFGWTPPFPNATPAQYVPRLSAAGLAVTDVRESRGALTFRDVAAVVYYLKTVPWEAPDFRVATHLDGLLRLQARLDGGRPLSFAGWKYLLEAHKAQ